MKSVTGNILAYFKRSKFVQRAQTEDGWPMDDVDEGNSISSELGDDDIG